MIHFPALRVGANMRRQAFVMGAALVAACGAHAQDTVLKGAQVTESALIDALAIEGPEAASGPSRGFRAPTRTAGADKKAAKPGAGKANLLVTFATNSSELTNESQGVLDALARALQSDALAGFSFRVEGHSDARGDDTHNQELSQERAAAVTAYLVKAHGILPERLTAVGKGSSEPLNTARVDAPENRRVTVVTIR
jgi:outer membrane protein OmpA-like peptidoglycan-associated protein